MRIGLLAGALAFAISLPYTASAQRGQPHTGRAAARIDLTGNWVSVVSEDWRLRMTTPRNGDYESVGAVMNGEARRTADAWNIEKDNAAGLQCKAFGVGGIIRQPGRIRVTWQDDSTLKME